MHKRAWTWVLVVGAAFMFLAAVNVLVTGGLEAWPLAAVPILVVVLVGAAVWRAARVHAAQVE